MIERALWDAAGEFQQFLQLQNYRFCFIGGIAYQRWGEPRVTRDMDVTVITGFGSERPFVETMVTRYQSRIPDAAKFAMQARVLLLSDVSGYGIDVSLGALPFEERVVERSSMWGTPGSGQIRTCSAEDLIVLKAFAGRPQDWIDVEKVIVRQGRQLNKHLILQELQPLAELKEEPEIIAHTERLLDKGQV